MQVNNQSPAFGMKYVEPRKWNPQVLKTLMESPLAKEIDAEYPKAKAIYKHHIDNEIPRLSHVKLTIELTKDKIIDFFTAFKDSPFGNEYSLSTGLIKKKIKESNLETLENIIKEKDEKNVEKAKKRAEANAIYAQAEANNAKLEAEQQAVKRNPLQKFICRIFGIK